MEIVAWVLVGLLNIVCLVLAKRTINLEQDLRAERALCVQAWQREEEAKAALRNSIRVNHDLAKQRPMYFAGQPTLDATAYRIEHQPLIVWWTYDN